MARSRGGDETMIECCGKPRASRFCPDCGKLLHDDDSLYGLLKHCRTFAAKYATAAAREARESQPGAEAGHAARSAERWQGWADTLGRLIDRAGPG